MIDLTARYAKVFDYKRTALGVASNLYFLRLAGKSAAGVTTYTLVKEVDSAWTADRVRGRDGAIYTKVEVADVANDMAATIDGAAHATHLRSRARFISSNPNR
jgi:hypothetical protein